METKQWQEFQPMVPSHPQCITRQTKVWYQLGTGQPSIPEAMDFVAATLTYVHPNEPTKFHVTSSKSSVPPELAPFPGASYHKIDSTFQSPLIHRVSTNV